MNFLNGDKGMEEEDISFPFEASYDILLSFKEFLIKLVNVLLK